jgi:hypothetical protein
MLPSRDQIERAAYLRWERRGRMHGADAEDWVSAEMDQIFDLNYRTAVEYELGEGQPRVLGKAQGARCRFCEQSAPRAAFSVRPVLPDVLDCRSLLTREICNECADQFAKTIDPGFAHFWESLAGLRLGLDSYRELRAPTAIPIAAYKALIRTALAITPEDQLSSFTDTIEWVSNPDHEFDSGLFGGTGCLLYHAHVPSPTGWVSLCSRLDDDAPFPYMLFFLALERVVLQVHLPLCSRDDDHDGSDVEMPERSFSTGVGSDLRPSTCLALPLKASDQAKPRRFRLFW